MIIRVIRGRLREKNLQDLRNLREIKIRDNPCHPWEVKIRNPWETRKNRCKCLDLRN